MAYSEGDHRRHGVWWPPDSGGSQTANIKADIDSIRTDGEHGTLEELTDCSTR